MLEHDLSYVNIGAYATNLLAQTPGVFGAEQSTVGVPRDPDVMPESINGRTQWYLTGIWGAHADAVWPDYTGQGVLVADLDDGFEYTHAELAANYRTDLDRDLLGNDNDAMAGSSDFHGTSVMGTILADDNGVGTVGVAFDAQGIGIRQGFGNDGDLDQTLGGFQYALTAHADVMNNSWGYSTPFADDAGKEFNGTDFYQITNAIKNLVDFGRDGDGANIVFSAGNSRTTGDNVNYHNIQNSPYAITVGAIDANGQAAYFSTPGAAILVAAGGVNDWTIDRTGNTGYATGDYTYFSGTSASAPVVSGVIALMLQANPGLGWRDVQQILAYSAQFNDPGNTGWNYNGAENWNGGGLHFSHDYGFGAVDAGAAVRLAEHWPEHQTSDTMTEFSVVASPGRAIPQTGTVFTSITVTQNISIEHVLIDLNITHARAGDLVVSLISPDGTESVLVNHPSNGAFTGIYGVTGIDFETSSVAHWGEDSAGSWLLKIKDTVSGNAGTLNSWGLTFMGSATTADDQYVYTDDFTRFSANQLADRNAITDINGGIDTINLSAVTYNVHLSMDDAAGQAHFLDGNGDEIGNSPLFIAAGSVIENAVLGDGNDVVLTNNADNRVYGGRGDDSITASFGDDYLDGGAGIDTARFNEYIGNFTFDFSDPLTLVSTYTSPTLRWDYGTDSWANFEQFVFNDGAFTFAGLESFVGRALGGINLNFIQGGAVLYSYHSFYAEDVTLKGTLFGLTDTNDVQLSRDGMGQLTVTYLDPAAPRDLQISGSDGNDSIAIVGGLHVTMDGGAGSDTVSFVNAAAAVTVSLAVAGAQDTGGAGTYTLSSIENVTGSAYADTLTGGAGANVIDGGNGNDILQGGGGDDIVKGGAGDDSYIWGAGSGADTISDESGTDKILITGLLPENLAFAANGNDLVIRSSLSSSDSVTIINQFNASNGIESLQFSDGFGIGLAGFKNWVMGTSAADTLYGDAVSNRQDVMLGGAGNDTIKGYNNDDILSGDAGNDKLYGGNGNDLLHGGSGNDTIYGEANNDTIWGGSGNDLVNGGTGDDIMMGGDGVDTVSFADATGGVTVNLSVLSVQNTGAGSDTISGFENLAGSAYNDTLTGDSANNVITGGAGNDLLVGGGGSDTLDGGAGDDTVSYAGYGEQVTVTANQNGYSVQHGAFTDTLTGIEHIIVPVQQASSSGDDTYTVSFIANQSIADTGGNDLLHLTGVEFEQLQWSASGGNLSISNGVNAMTLVDQLGGNPSHVIETLSFDDGLTMDLRHYADWAFATGNISGGDTAADTIIDNGGNHILHGLGLDDVLIGGVGNDSLYGEAGNDQIRGGDGTDTLTGGAGDDRLWGGAGNDIFVWGAGAGADTVSDTGGLDTISASGVLPESLIFSASGVNLVMTSGWESLTLSGQLSTGTIPQIEQLGFSDGFTVALTDYSHWKTGTSASESLYGDAMAGYRDVMFGGAGNDVLKGYNNDDTLSGDAGNDKLYGGNGNDLLHGGSGNDLLYGEDGNDTLWGGAGADTLSGGAGADRFMFDGGTASADTIADFSRTEDILDFSHLLTSFDPLTQAITDFVQISDSGANSMVKVDLDGAGTANAWTAVATLNGVTGLTDEQALMNSGHLIG